jgi:hypothetical protein
LNTNVRLKCQAPSKRRFEASHGLVALHCARGKVAELAGWLLTQGAERVSVAALEQTFVARSALYEALARAATRANCIWVEQRVIASHRASKDVRPSGRAMAKQSRERSAPYGSWIAASLRSSR